MLEFTNQDNHHLLLDMIDEGYVMYKENGNGLFLLNYTDKCTYDKVWNKVTLESRGSVFSTSTLQQVAFPFKKFFNFSELTGDEKVAISKRMENEIESVTEKIDGSLGILYFYNGKWYMNTRGSFDSEQAIHGLKIFKEKYENLLTITDIENKGYTILVEIVYPSNKIIVNYDDIDDLYLLDVINSKGESLLSIYENLIPMRHPKKYNFKSLSEIAEYIDSYKDGNFEGCVVKLKDESRYKFKTLNYISIARFLSNFSMKSIYAQMNNGKVLQSFKESIPEENRDYAENMILEAEKQYSDIKSNMKSIYDKHSQLIEANSNLQELKKKIGTDNNIPTVEKNILFLMIAQDSKKIDQYIMRQLLK